MAQSNNILHTLKQCGFSDNEIVSAIRQASNPNDIAEITSIILQTQRSQATKAFKAAYPNYGDYDSGMIKDLDIDPDDKELLDALKMASQENEEKKQKPPQDIVLPPGWEQCHTNDGKIYYQNHNDRSTHWNIPEEAYWSECTTNDGKTYYQCHRDKSTHWQLPKGIKLSQSKSKSSSYKPAAHISLNKNIPEKQSPNNPKKKAKAKKDIAYWQELGWKCGLKGDMTEYINEVINDDEYKNASDQEKQMIMQQLQLQQQKMAMHNQQMAMNQFNHQQNMCNMANSTMREVNARQHVQLMNASNWGPNAPKYYLKKDYEYSYNNNQYGPF